MFVADTRTDRVSLDGARCLSSTTTMGAHQTGSPRSMMGCDQLKALTDWADQVQRLGLLVLGQPLLARSTGAWTFDTTLADYESDYEKIVTRLRKNIEERGVSFIVLTGDIHWGRLEDEDRRLLRRFLPGFAEECVFATGDNNFGMLSLAAPGDDRRDAIFELWSLTTLKRAENNWLKTSECLRERLAL